MHRAVVDGSGDSQFSKYRSPETPAELTFSGFANTHTLPHLSRLWQ